MSKALVVSEGRILTSDGGSLAGAPLEGTAVTSATNFPLEWPGPLITPHDALYVYANQFVASVTTNGTPVDVSGGVAAVPRVTLADAATQRVRWNWAIPVGWGALDIRVGFVNEAATTGNVRFQLDYSQHVLGSTNIVSPTTTTLLATLASGNQNAHTYHNPSAWANIPVSTGAFQDWPFMVLSLTRLGSDGADTLAGGCSISVITATRAG